MTIILAAVVLAIDQARVIVTSLQHVNPSAVPIHTLQFTVWPVLLLVPVGAALAGAAGWIVLFVLHRSGVQKFADYDPATRS